MDVLVRVCVCPLNFCFQLMPVERYAVSFVEHQHAPLTQEELQKAEVRTDDFKPVYDVA